MNKLIVLLLLAALPCITRAGEIIRITPATRHLVPKGKSTDAIDGDWILKNDKIIAIVGDAIPGREANMRVQSVQGAVIDLTSLADNNDYLAAFYPQGYPAADSRKNPAIFANHIEAINKNGREILLRATRDANDKIPYESITEYSLRDGEDFLRVRTIYTNKGTEKALLVFADKLRMDMDIKDDVPALGKHQLAFMYNKWFNAAYAVYREEGLLLTEKPRTDSDPGTGLLVSFQDATASDTGTVVLEPGQRIEASRFLLYGKDVAEIQRRVASFEKIKRPLTTVTLADTRKQPLAGVFVQISNDQAAQVSFAITDANGKAALPLPAGNYQLLAAKIGHDTVRMSLAVSGKAKELAVAMQPLTSLQVTVKEGGTGRMIPVKLQFKGINGSRDPYLGTSKRAEGTNNQYYASKSRFDISIPPGDYELTVSHGPEYETVTRQVKLGTGDRKSIDLTLNRLFDSPGWVIADFHNHSTRSGDNDVETRSRIINLAAAGMEFAPATEHNRISSYTPEIKAMGLQSYLASAAGIELTGPTGVQGGPNHENAFPLTVMDGKQGGGFPPINGDVYVQMKGLYDYDNGKEKFMQHNHPGMGIPNLYFDKDRDGVMDEGFGTRSITNAIELQTFMYDILNVGADETRNRKTPVFFWLQMLNQGDRIFATMTSDSHMVGDRGGLRFVYVYAKKDKPQEIDSVEIGASARNGHMVVSNGPFLRADIDGALPGDDVKAGVVKPRMNVEVYANNEITIDRVQVLVDGRQVKTLNFTRESHPALYSSKALQFKHSFDLDLSRDANVIVVATGKKLTADTAPADSRMPRQVPIAVTNPFFIDVSGDGFTASKDTLGEPLPVSPRRVAANATAE